MISHGATLPAGEARVHGAGESAPPEGLPYDWPNREASFGVEAGGVRWHVQRAGRGPCLLLLHGTAASTHTWRDLFPLLAEDYDVIAIDLPGHGYTSLRPDGAMTLDALAASTVDLLRALGASPAYVAGHSAGAAIALRMALDGGIDPRSVVGLNAALLPFGGLLKAVFSPMAGFFATTRLMPRLVARRARDVKAVRRILVGTGSVIDDRGVELYQRLLEREGHVSAVLSMMASWDLEPLLRDLPALQAKLYLMSGGRDKAVSPKEAERIAERLPATRVTKLDDCGHLAHEEAPERVAELIRAACPPTGGAATDG